MGLLDAEDWTAEWISFKDDSPLAATQTNVVLPAPRHYRKPFSAGKPIRRATVYATALGLYELSINGQPVTDQLFTPGWSDYRKRVYYNTFDVTGLVQQGKNPIGAIVADGWYSGYVAFGLRSGWGPNRSGRTFYGKTPALRIQLEIEYEDGTTNTVVTDPSWRTSEGFLPRHTACSRPLAHRDGLSWWASTPLAYRLTHREHPQASLKA